MNRRRPAANEARIRRLTIVAPMPPNSAASTLWECSKLTASTFCPTRSVNDAASPRNSNVAAGANEPLSTKKISLSIFIPTNAT